MNKTLTAIALATAVLASAASAQADNPLTRPDGMALADRVQAHVKASVCTYAPCWTFDRNEFMRSVAQLTQKQRDCIFNEIFSGQESVAETDTCKGQPRASAVYIDALEQAKLAEPIVKARPSDTARGAQAEQWDKYPVDRNPEHRSAACFGASMYMAETLGCTQAEVTHQARP
jgi:hypothetical protein